MIFRRTPELLLLLLALLMGPVLPAAADDVGLTSARLVELTEGGYALEADVSPVQVAALRPPVVPARFTLAGRPSYRRAGAGLVVRYEFGGSEVPLGAEEALLLPWARSAVLLTARWRDGTVQRAMFPRGPAGIRVPVEALKPVERSATAVARRHIGAGLDGVATNFLRLLLLLGIVTGAGGAWRSVRLALVLAGGHALSMVALDLGVPALHRSLADAGLGIGAALLARSALREDSSRLWPLLLALGLVDGLGIAAGLKTSGLAPGELVPALFGAIAGVDALLLAGALLLVLVWRIARSTRWSRVIRDGVATAVGCLSVIAVIGATASGLAGAGVAGVDPADSMAAARFEFSAGAGPGGRGTGARVAAAPRRLEDAAMIFLTVEPAEVRVEVLLSLLQFLEPLRIAGGRGSTIPVDVQAAIAARARRMVSETLDVVIDGREGIPLLERSDFVMVAATGITTRRESEPESLDLAVLGVTLAYGVDRPPSEISAMWRVFPAPETAIPAVWTDPTGSERVTLTAEQPVLRWAGDLASFATPPLRAVVVTPPRWPVASLALAVLAALWMGPLRRRWAAAVGTLAFAALVAAIALYPFVRTALPGLGGWTPARAEAAEVVDGLLTNVYRSFDLRDEEAIYDRLAVSVTGEQLSEVYLENRRALELENRGGARARVDEVEVLEVRSVRRDGEGGFRVEATWTVSGSVNHFGHVHYRQNRYDAALHLLAVEDVWRIRGIEILDERRVL